MPFSEQYHLPTYEELSVPEIQLTSAAMKAASLQMGKYCDSASKEFMLCRKENGGDPRPCINEGKEVTRCGIEFLQKVKKNCAESFTEYWRCLDTSQNMKFTYCRSYQKVFDECLEQKLGQSRPDIQHFMKIRLHETPRAKPEAPELPEPITDLRDTDAEPRSKFYGGHSFSR